MVILKRSDRFSIDLNFNKEGLTELIRIFNNITMTRQEKLNVMLDGAIFRRGNITKREISICYIDYSDAKLLREEDEIKLIIAKEDIEYAKERFIDCLKNGYFSPAEFIQVQVERRKNLDCIYCQNL